MADPLITLTTDFGLASPYVAAVKGVILGFNPAARLIDLSHALPPHDVYHAAFFLASSVVYFPEDTLHVVVVDPGVGSERAVLYVEVANQRLLVPDNGCWVLLAEKSEHEPRVRKLTEQRYWASAISSTFHGRDVFAPVAGHLSLGVDPRELGPWVSSWVTLEKRTPTAETEGLTGEVEFVDDFGNLITNLPGEILNRLADRPHWVCVGDTSVPRCVRTYADAKPGELVALASSNGALEVAVAQGSAAKALNVGVGATVTVRWEG
jgi:S-adenosylmethionine hydrolase